MMKKFLLTLGSVSALAAPMVTVIACGDDHAHEDGHDDDHHDHEHVDQTVVGAALVALDEHGFLVGELGSMSIITQTQLDALVKDNAALEHVVVTIDVHKGTDGSLNTGDIVELVATPVEGYEYNNHAANVTVDHTIGTGSVVADEDDHDHDH